MPNPFDYFDAIYCINLDRRTDRWEEVQKEFEKVGIRERVVRFSAIETPENGHIGCMLSHRAIIQKAKDMGWKNVLVFEDDVIISASNEYLDDFFTSSQKYPWHILYFGGDIIHSDIPCLQKLNGNIYKCIGIRGGFALAYNNTIYDKLLGEFSADKKEATIFIKKYTAFDAYLSRYLQKNILAIMYSCVLAVQNPGYSNIGEIFINKHIYNIDNFYFWRVVNSKKSISSFIFYFRPLLIKMATLCKVLLHTISNSHQTNKHGHLD